MLPLPELDDRSFKQIFEQAREMIPKIFPQWTDRHYHDPGITFIELFAYLTEMQEYYLNRVTAKNQMKFLKLMNSLPKQAERAVTDISFEGVTGNYVIPRGSLVAADEQPFETAEPLNAVPSKVARILAADSRKFFDFTADNTNGKTVYSAFGSPAKAGNCLLIGLDGELPAETEISMSFILKDDYPIERNQIKDEGENFIPSARIVWEYYAGIDSEERENWLPLKIIRDGTFHLTLSGKLKFSLEAQMAEKSFENGGERPLFWIRGTLAEYGCEVPVKINEVSLNSVLAYHGQTLSEVFRFSGTGKPCQSVELTGYLSYYGTIEVQVMEGEGLYKSWHEVGELTEGNNEEPCYSIAKDEDSKRVTVTFGDGAKGRIPPEGQMNILVIASLPDFKETGIVGKSKRLPGQSFRLNWLTGHLPLQPGSMVIQVGDWDSSTREYLWSNWNWTMDFDNSRACDRHFVLDENNEVCFGDNEKGMIPGDTDNNIIRIISCTLGGGENGNISENRINRMYGFMDEPLSVINKLPSSGGRNKESIEDAQMAMLKDLKRQHRAVTPEDYEVIVKETPGLMVARVKALPLFSVGLKDYPSNKAPAQVTVVVVPYSEDSKPLPGNGFLETVRRHLEPYRLVTTELHVIPPEYFKITVRCVVVVASHIVFKAEKVKELLNRIFDPLGRENGFEGWPFGGTVRKGDINSEINRLEGVEFIKELDLRVEGDGAVRDISGDIKIPPHGLVYCEDHEVEIVTGEDL